MKTEKQKKKTKPKQKPKIEFRKSAGIITYRKNAESGEREYLLLEYGNGGHWDYAKGGVERGEGERDAAARELREETGLSGVRFVEGFRETLHYFFRDKHAKTKTEGDGNPPLVSKTVAFFLAEAPANARVKLSREHSDYAWLSFEDAVAKATFRNAKETLRKTEEFLKAKEK